MAKEKAVESVERVYTIPLRRGWSKAPANIRTNRAVNDIKRFLSKHVKVDDVKVSPRLNGLLWKRGSSRPPASVKVKVSVEEETVTARLPDEVVVEKKGESKGRLEGLKDKAKALQGGQSVSQAVKSDTAKSEPEKAEEKGETTKPGAKKEEAEAGGKA
jgi:large subunit ribosomal protein L31e